MVPVGDPLWRRRMLINRGRRRRGRRIRRGMTAINVCKDRNTPDNLDIATSGLTSVIVDLLKGGALAAEQSVGQGWRRVFTRRRGQVSEIIPPLVARVTSAARAGAPSSVVAVRGLLLQDLMAMMNWFVLLNLVGMMLLDRFDHSWDGDLHLLRSLAVGGSGRSGDGKLVEHRA